jgi:hypothetical protein
MSNAERNAKKTPETRQSCRGLGYPERTAEFLAFLTLPQQCSTALIRSVRPLTQKRTGFARSAGLP